jgi:DNA-binding SARP family transcriptional activator
VQDGVELGILGQLEVTGPSGPIMLGAAKERLLLAVLAVDRQRAVSRDRLVDELWNGEQRPRSAMNALQNYVLRLRRALAGTQGLCIATVPGGYRLETADGRVEHDQDVRVTCASANSTSVRTGPSVHNTASVSSNSSSARAVAHP